MGCGGHVADEGHGLGVVGFVAFGLSCCVLRAACCVAPLYGLACRVPVYLLYVCLFPVLALIPRLSSAAPFITLFETCSFVYGHTHEKATVPVSLTESKLVLAASVLGRVTTREYAVS